MVAVPFVPAQSVLIDNGIGNGSFEQVDPHTAPITGPINGRRAINAAGSFEVPGWSFEWLAGYVGIDPARNAQHGSSYAFVNTASAMEMTSDTIDVSPLALEAGDVLELSFWLAGDRNWTDVKVTPIFVVDGVDQVRPAVSLTAQVTNEFQSYRFAHQLMSGASEVALRFLLDNISTGADQPRVDGLILRAIPEEQLSELPQPMAELFVAPDGDDSDAGTIDAPLATLDGARARIRDFNPLPGLPEGGTTVNFRGGEYYVDQMTVFDGLDSGSPGRPIVYRSFPGERARFVGGLQLDPADYSEVTSDDPVWSSIDGAARGQLLKMDLAPYMISDFGEPNANQTSNQLVELSFNGQVMELGRWPNGGANETTSSPRGDDFFTYLGNRPERWTAAPDPYARGQFSTGYFAEIVPISEIDTASKTIHLAENPSGRGAGHNKAWSVFNLLEEIDEPGEYYIDRANSVLYFWPPSDVFASKSLLSIYGAPGQHAFDIRGAAHVRFENLTFEMFNDRISRVWSSDHLTFDGCAFRNSGEIGLSISESTELTIQNCTFEALGSTGLLVARNGDRANLVPANIRLVNNLFSGTGRWKTGLTYAPPVWIFGDNCGLHIAHNRFENTRHVGMAIFGGNLTTVEFNRFSRCSTEADDCAAIYAAGGWGALQGSVFRHNEFKDITNTNLPGDYGGHGVRALYYDFGAGGALAEGNIAYNVGDRVWLNNWARDVEYKNNITARSGSVYWATDTPSSRGCELLASIAEFDYDVPGSAWYDTFPHLREVPNDCNAPEFGASRHTLGKVSGDMTWRSGTYAAGSGIPYYDFPPGSLQDVDPKFYDEEAGCFALQEDSPAYGMPGFERIPWELIGRLDLQRTSRPVPPDEFDRFVSDPSGLYWAPAYGAAFHRVYLSTDRADVEARAPSAMRAEVSGSAYVPEPLAYTTYYWAVDAYGDSGLLMGDGDVWSFTVFEPGTALSAGPIAYWPFDEGAGTRARELIGGNDAIGVNMEGDEWSPGISGSAIDLDGNFTNPARPNYFGSGEMMRADTVPDQGGGATALTLSLWLNPDIDDDGRTFPNTRGYYGVMGTGEGSPQYWALNFFFDTVTQSNGVDFRGHAGGLSIVGDSVNSAGGWYHLAGVWTGSQKILYLNGREIAREPAIGSPVDVSTWQFGRDRSLAERFFDGQIDDAAIFADALTPEDIALIHRCGRDGIPLIDLSLGFANFDSDGDGTPDSLERFFGSDPYSIGAANYQRLSSDGGGTLTLTFSRAKTYPDLLPQIETSTDLVTWFRVPEPDFVIDSSAPTRDELWTTIAADPHASAFYVRLKLSHR